MNALRAIEAAAVRIEDYADNVTDFRLTHRVGRTGPHAYGDMDK